MPTIYMVRHGRAAAGFDSHLNPGLDDLGWSQARAAALELMAAIPAPIPIHSSPLARARETALPLARRWGTTIAIEPRVAEIPSPTDDLGERARWLRGIMAGRWSDLPADLRRWRQSMIDCVLGIETDAVVFCHFIAINIIAGAATDAESLIVFRPDNGSITRIGTHPGPDTVGPDSVGTDDVGTDGGQLTVLELGRQAETRVN